MMNGTNPATQVDLDNVIHNLALVIVVFSGVSAVLFVLVALLAIALCFVIFKLKAHERTINALETQQERSFKNQAFHPTEQTMMTNQVRTGPDGAPRRERSSMARESRARMTIAIEQESVNVYGNKPPLGQTIRLAQDYYKSRTNTDTDVPAESVQVQYKDINRRVVQSTIFTEDWRSGHVPTSMIFTEGTENVEDVVTLNEGIFVHQTIGPVGGNLTISGVQLTIPPGTIDTPTLLSVGLLWDEQYLPKLTKRQTMLSPIVLCQPSGMTFNGPVTLSFPHAARDVARDWNVRILKREGNLSANSDWSDISIADYTERNINADRVSLDLLHFTLYTCIGESKDGRVAVKDIRVVAFAGSPRPGDFFKPRIYCLNNYKEEITSVEDEERDRCRDASMMESAILLVHDNDQDVMVELVQLSDGWNVDGNKVEAVPFEQIWHALHPHCTFILEQVETSRDIRCEFQAYQNGRENHAAKLKIAEKMTTSKIALNADDPLSDIVNELVYLLDPINLTGSDAGDWKNLAEKMGCGLARIKWLGSQESPTKILCTEWLEREQRSLDELEQLLRDINRPDAADEVRKRSNHVSHL